MATAADAASSAGLLARTDLAASYFTLTGSALGEPPRHSLASRAAAATEAGFTALALAPGELVHARESAAGINGLREIIDRHELAVTELEPLRGWDGEGVDADSALADELAMYELADAFGSRQINAIQVVGPEVPRDLVAERFAAICDRAADHGLIVAFEPRANSPVSTAAGAAELLKASGRSNTGIVLDSYHVHRSGVTLEDLAGLPAGMIASVQLNDMHAVPIGSAFEDATEHRLPPGEGDIDLAAWLVGLGELGIDVPIAVEVMSREFTHITVEEAARRAADGARTVLAGARNAGS